LPEHDPQGPPFRFVMPFVLEKKPGVYGVLRPSPKKEFRHSLIWPDNIDFTNGIIRVSVGHYYLQILTETAPWQFSCIIRLNDYDRATREVVDTLIGIDATNKHQEMTNTIRLRDGYHAHYILEQDRWDGDISVRQATTGEPAFLPTFVGETPLPPRAQEFIDAIDHFIHQTRRGAVQIKGSGRL
jgi:hypothetical protein